MAGFRDANLMIIFLSSHANSVQVGLGVSPELIGTPAFTFKTVVYHKPNVPLSQRKASDYALDPAPNLIPLSLFSSPASHASLDGDHHHHHQLVVDWKALDTFFRHLLFRSLNLPKPPLAQHILLSIPPNLPHAVRDKLTQLFFESLQAPALLLAESPLLQLLACNAVSGTVVDIGSHSTLVGFVSDSLLIGQACFYFPVGEHDCDDYLISLLLSDDPTLPTRLGVSSDKPAALYDALLGLVAGLKADGHIRYSRPLGPSFSAPTETHPEEEDVGIADVAEALVSGKADRIIGRSLPGARRPTQGKKLQAEHLRETDTIIVAPPSGGPLSAPSSPLLDTPADIRGGIAIASTRHRHAEPLFSPELLKTIPAVFERFGLKEHAQRYADDLKLAEDENIVESIRLAILKISDRETRKDVAGQLLVTGSGDGGNGLMSRTEGLSSTLSSELQAVFNSLPQPPNKDSNTNTHSNPSQSQNQTQHMFKSLKIPDYFSEFKSKSELSGFLGGCIVAKLGFGDASASKMWISKPDYSKEGPFVCRKLLGIGSSSG